VCAAAAGVFSWQARVARGESARAVAVAVTVAVAVAVDGRYKNNELPCDRHLHFGGWLLSEQSYAPSFSSYAQSQK
jgi:hypothetical protein